MPLRMPLIASRWADGAANGTPLIAGTTKMATPATAMAPVRNQASQ